jgi:UDP-GlcNAc:undecaprenyl-phosphate GlcNAc-1-phosphate transferase
MTAYELQTLLLGVFVTASAASLLMVPLLSRWCVRHGILGRSDERGVPERSIPRLGGIGICLSLLVTLLLYVDLQRELRGILAGVVIIFITGLLDDVRGVSSLGKFFGEACAVLTTMVVGNLYIQTLGDLFGMGELVLPHWLAIPFTLVAVVGVVNAFNLIDGLDGLAGGLAVIALAAFGLLALSAANRSVLVIAMALLGAVLGFLRYNVFPARIFMGDAGSLTIGFVISFLAISLTQGEGILIQPVVPLLIIGLPVADTLRVMVGRLRRGQSPFAADRTHIHHRFLALGISHRTTVFLLYGISLVWAAAAVMFRDSQAELLLGSFAAASVLSYVALHWLTLPLVPVLIIRLREWPRGLVPVRRADASSLTVPVRSDIRYASALRPR